MDVHTKNQRSYNMSRVKSKNTVPEKLMFSMLKRADYKFKKHYSVVGKPDIAFPDYKVAVFIDGEFWHGKDFEYLKDRLSSFWVKKIGDTIKRDKKVRRELKLDGWHIIRFWDKRIVHKPRLSFKQLVQFLEKTKNRSKE